MTVRTVTDELTTVAGLGSAISAHARRYGIAVEPICKTLGIDPKTFDDLTARVSLDRICRLMEACATLAHDEAFGATIARDYEAGSSGPFGYGLTSAPTGLDFVQFIDAHMQYATHTSYCRLSLQSDGTARLDWTFAPVIVRRDQYVDMSVALVIKRARELATHAAQSIEVELERQKPANTQPFRECLSRRISFGAAMNSLRFPKTFLTAVNPVGDKRLFELMSLQCRNMRPNAESANQDFVEQVRRYLLLHVAEEDSPLAQVAAYFGLSERTFQRRLSEHNTTLNDLKDDVRRDVSFNLLTQSDLPFSEICYRLGYSAPSAFTRSVTRWFGSTPTEVREGRSA